MKFMKKARTSLIEKKRIGLKQSQHLSQNLTNTNKCESNEKECFSEHGQYKKQQGQKAKEKVTEEPTVPSRETVLETPDQSIDGVERKTTESTPMKNKRRKQKSSHQQAM